MDLKNWVVGQSYNYSRDVNPLAEGHDYKEFNMGDDGEFRIGKGFITVSDDKGSTLSFIMCDWNARHGTSMKLVYKHPI